ncbi:unnamed protein product, partial [Polarella glacialis]
AAWTPEARPLVDFNASQARAMCVHGAGDIVYYARTCAQVIPDLEASSRGAPRFLALEAAAYALRLLARELAGTADVGLFAFPSLQRFLLGEASAAVRQGRAGEKSGQTKSLGCAVGSALSWAWLASSEHHDVRVLPLATMTGRVLEDITGALLKELWASRVRGLEEQGGHLRPLSEQGALSVSLEQLRTCDVLLGPEVALLDLLAFSEGRLRRSLKLGLHGQLPSRNLKQKSSDLQVSEAVAVRRSLTAELAGRGWKVELLSISDHLLLRYLSAGFGFSLFLASANTSRNGPKLADLAVRQGARIIQGTPATWRSLVHGGLRGHGGLAAICGGEAFPPSLARPLQRCAGGGVWNAYGPTEATIWATTHFLGPEDGDVDSNRAVPIGLPLPNTELLVIEAAGREDWRQGSEDVGELLVGGAGVALGYHRRPELTAASFIARPAGAARSTVCGPTAVLLSQ